MTQTCKACGRIDKFDFHVPDELWNKVVPLQYRRRVICLVCFDEFARQTQTAYADALHVIYFAGAKAVFEFRVASAVDIADL